jgi:hypothetical protein
VESGIHLSQGRHFSLFLFHFFSTKHKTKYKNNKKRKLFPHIINNTPHTTHHKRNTHTHSRTTKQRILLPHHPIINQQQQQQQEVDSKTSTTIGDIN